MIIIIIISISVTTKSLGNVAAARLQAITQRGGGVLLVLRQLAPLLRRACTRDHPPGCNRVALLLHAVGSWAAEMQ